MDVTIVSTKGRLPIQNIQRAFRFVKASAGPLETPCWIWTGHLSAKTYGSFSHRFPGEKHSRGIKAHRLMWEHFNGPIPDGLDCCHKCDIPACCNPDHLFVGTVKDNMADMIRKGRKRKGSNNYWAKLHEGIVPEIRLFYSWGLSHYTLAKHYNVSPSSIYATVIRKTWRHVA